MANMDWDTLGFKYRKTNTVVSSVFSNGGWSPLESQPEDKISISVCSPSFHYGMECFEGLKAFRGVDGKVRIFRWEENAARLKTSTDFLGLPCPSEELFKEAVFQAVRENIDFLPPYGHKAALYIRPVVITTEPSVNLVPQDSGIRFMVFVFPVGTYIGGKVLQMAKAVIGRDFDRAAPNGSGRFKVGGNYACAMHAEKMAVSQGYGDVLFLDPMTHTKIDEFSSANFFGIKGDSYITPLSDSILPSITNKSLIEVAKDLGLKVERRAIPLEELSEIDEVAECGTAAVLIPISVIDDRPSLRGGEITKSYTFGEECGPWCRKLYDTLTGIQFGTVEDTHSWCTILDE